MFYIFQEHPFHLLKMFCFFKCLDFIGVSYFNKLWSWLNEIQFEIAKVIIWLLQP
jgi:hypothetical protein